MRNNQGRWPRRRWWSDQVRRRPRAEGLSGRVLAIIEELELRQLALIRARALGGCCRSCGGPISARRLRTVDGAVLCTACALLARRSRTLLEPLARRN